MVVAYDLQSVVVTETTVFSTFDMDKLGKIRRIKISALKLVSLPSLKVIPLKANKVIAPQSCETL